jgi:hypothetical protein
VDQCPIDIEKQQALFCHAHKNDEIRMTNDE